MKKNRKPERGKDRTVIPLEDLAPRADPKGGAGILRKTVFGESPLLEEKNESKPSGRKVPSKP